MALEKYQEYLAAQVLNEGRPVTYRLLSRAMKVHSNTAKQMLYEFHRAQNRRKPGSVHATYLVTGIQKPDDQKAVSGNADGDVAMKDDSEMSSSMPQPDEGDAESQEPVPTTAITLVQEEHLEDIKGRHESIDAIHVYSIEPTTLSHIQILSDCTRRVVTETASEDPLETWKQYGIIGNPDAKRRAGGRPPPAPKPQLATTAGMKPATNKTPTLTKSDSSTSNGSKTTSNQPPAAKRQKSDLFKSFAKSQPPKPKADDAAMMDADDEEDDTFDKPPENSAAVQAKSEEARRAKLEREETLRKMMEQDEDEEHEDSEAEVPAVDKAAEDIEQADVEMQETDGPAPEPQPEPEQTMTITDGRRRGRRKVMKKKTTKDAEGFLVTKQEPVWESFSEEDTPAAAPQSKKQSSGPGKAPATSDKGSAGKKGQGNIMSFFSKK